MHLPRLLATAQRTRSSRERTLYRTEPASLPVLFLINQRPLFASKSPFPFPGTRVVHRVPRVSSLLAPCHVFTYHGMRTRRKYPASAGFRGGLYRERVIALTPGEFSKFVPLSKDVSETRRGGTCSSNALRILNIEYSARVRAAKGEKRGRREKLHPTEFGFFHPAVPSYNYRIHVYQRESSVISRC